jgi:hypothetical protein
MYNMAYNTPMLHLGTADFRKEVSDEKLRRLVHKNRAVEVGRYAQGAAAVVVSPEFFAALAESEECLEALRATLPLLLAAVRSGAGVPSETLTQLGIDPADQSWQALNEFQATYPVRFTASETGGPLARGRLTPQAFIPEADLELELTDD